MNNPGLSQRIDEARTRIRQAGLRSTAPRIAVYSALYAAPMPLSHSELAEDLSNQGFDKATIYRNLIHLTEAGLVSRSDLGDHVWRFELVRQDSGVQHSHPHFSCESCGEVTCLPNVNVSVKATRGNPELAPFGTVRQVLLKGVCTRCQ